MLPVFSGGGMIPQTAPAALAREQQSWPCRWRARGRCGRLFPVMCAQGGDGFRPETVHGVVVRGHRVASGLARDPRFPRGTIAAQAPVFRALGVDLSPFLPATLNVDVSPWSFSPGPRATTLRLVKWHPDAPPETFSFADARLEWKGRTVRAAVYWPHPETKPEHFQPPGIVEVLAEPLEGLEYGDQVALRAAPGTAEWSWLGDGSARFSSPGS